MFKRIVEYPVPIPPSDPSFPKVKCEAERIIREKAAINYFESDYEDHRWQQLARDLGMNLMTALAPNSPEPLPETDPLSKGYLVTVARKENNNDELNVKELILEATLWKVTI